MSFKLGNGEYFIDANEKGELQVNGKAVGEQSSGASTVTVCAADKIA